MATAVTFFVEGVPATAGSKRHVGKGRIVDSCKRNGPWRKCIQLAARQSMEGDLPWPPGTPLAADFEFVVSKPKGTPKRVTAPVTRPDLLKMARAVEDALTQIAYHDDSQIVVETLSKRFALPDEPVGVRVTIEPAPA